MNFFFKNLFFFNLVWNLSKNFSTFVGILQQSRQKCILRVQRNTLTKTLCWLCETISDFGREIVRFAVEDLHCTKICTICLQVGNWKIIFERKFSFSLFFGRPGNIFWFFRWIILGMVVKTAFFKPSGTYPLGRIFWQNVFFIIPDYEGTFPKFSLKYLRQGCQNCSLCVQTSTLRRVPDYEGIFLNLHWNISGMIVKTTAYVFRGALWERFSFLRFFQTCFRTLSDNRPEL